MRKSIFDLDNDGSVDLIEGYIGYKSLKLLEQANEYQRKEKKKLKLQKKILKLDKKKKNLPLIIKKH